MTHHIVKYKDIDNFAGVSSITLLLLSIDLRFVGTWATTNKIIGNIPDFTVLNVPIFQHWHNIAMSVSLLFVFIIIIVTLTHCGLVMAVVMAI